MHRPRKTLLRSLGLLGAAAALLSACGGGGGGTDAPATSIQLTVATPTNSGGVFEVQTPFAVQTQVQINGAAATDGTQVNLSMPGGVFSPASTTTRNGVATSSLTGATAGTQTITATAQANGASASATQTIYLRPVPAALEILVPAYFLPSSGTGWSQMAASASGTPGVRITAILNPSNGVFTTANAQLLSAARDLVTSGGSVVGYVYTRYGNGTRSMADIKTNIDRYLALYGRDVISGIFLDEMASDARQIDFYREIYSYIKSKDAALRVMGNPGTTPADVFATAADLLVTFEGTAADYQNYDPRSRSAWLYALPNARQSALVHNTDTCTAMQTAVRSAASARFNAGVVYATDLRYNASTGVGNPWASLPTYWTSLVSTVQAVNTGSVLPTC